MTTPNLILRNNNRTFSEKADDGGNILGWNKLSLSVVQEDVSMAMEELGYDWELLILSAD